MNTTSITYDVPTLRKPQVLVIGGGCAGIAAAVCAARHGAQVLLAEMNGCLGGTGTAGLVGPFMTCYDPAGERRIIRGFFEELVQRMVARGGAIPPEDCAAGTTYSAYRVSGHAHCTPFSAEAYKLVAEALCLEVGVEVLYHATLVSARMDASGKSILGAVLATKGGLIQVEAAQYIDCTGDADLSYAAGAPTAVGDAHGQVQPASMFFSICGVDKARLEAAKEGSRDISDMYFEKEMDAEMAAGTYTVPRNKVSLYESSDGTFRVNMSRINGMDALDPFARTKGTLDGRRQIDEIIALLRRLVPGCENAELVQSAAMLGIRESRRIVGDFVLDGEDIRRGRRFSDDVFIAGSAIDMHGGKDVRYEALRGEPYGVPYRTLLPQRIDNLLVAGRCASMDREALAALRVMPPVIAMGQAAGTAAALCLKQGAAPKDVDVQALRQALLSDGVLLD